MYIAQFLLNGTWGPQNLQGSTENHHKHTGITSDVYTLSSGTLSRFLLVVLEDLPLSSRQGDSSDTVTVRSGVGCWGDTRETVVSLDDSPESSRDLEDEVATLRLGLLAEEYFTNCYLDRYIESIRIIQRFRN